MPPKKPKKSAGGKKKPKAGRDGSPTRGKTPQPKDEGLDVYAELIRDVITYATNLVADEETARIEASQVITAHIRGYIARKQEAPELVDLRDKRRRRILTQIEEADRLELEREQKNAAVLIQSHHRGRQVRKELNAARAEEDAASTRIQASYRGRQTRKKIEEAKREEAAKVIQHKARGYLDRKQYLKEKKQRDDAVSNHAASVIQAHVKGRQTRKAFTERYDREAMCICNRLAYGRMLICDDCYETFHIECAGYSAENPPDLRVPWVCHNCSGVRDPVDIVVAPKAQSASASLARIRIHGEGDLQRIGLVGDTVPRPRMADDPMAALLEGEARKAADPERMESALLPPGARDRMMRTSAHTLGLDDEVSRMRAALEELMLDHYGDYKSVPPLVGVNEQWRPMSVPVRSAVERPSSRMSASSALAYILPGVRRQLSPPPPAAGGRMSRSSSVRKGPPSRTGSKAARSVKGSVKSSKSMRRKSSMVAAAEGGGGEARTPATPVVSAVKGSRAATPGTESKRSPSAISFGGGE